MGRPCAAFAWVYNYLNASTIIRMVGRPTMGQIGRSAERGQGGKWGKWGKLELSASPSGAICDTQLGG
ncbi:hypothetical protein ACLKA6_000202 [Drosophila palustris]